MAVTDLITVERAILNSTLATLNENNPDAVAALISAASSAIVGYCAEDFISQSYSEYYDGGGVPYQRLALRRTPVTEITRLATSPQTVLTVQNTSTTTNQRATVQTTTTGIKLVTVASAVTTTTTLLYATYPTLTAMATAITNVGSGWTPTVATGCTLFPSADLKPLQGACDARNNVANLELFVEDLMPWLTGVGITPYAGSWSSDTGWRLNADTGELWGNFPQGRQNIWVQYVAGETEAPDDVQEACVLMAQDMYQTELANRSLKGEVLGPTAKEYADSPRGMSATVKDLLSRHVAWDRLSGLA